MAIDENVLSDGVDTFVRNHGAKFIPDALERKMYKKMFLMLMNLFDKYSGKCMFTFMGHTISFVINPGPIVIDDEDDKDEDVVEIDDGSW